MKVMYLLDHYNSPYSGAESQLYKLILQLKQKNVDVKMAVLRPSDYLSNHDFPCEVTCLHIYKMLHPKTAFKLHRFAKQCKNDGYKVVHILLNDSSIFAPPVLKLAGLKVIVSRLDMGFWYTKLNLPLLRFSRFFVDKVLANGSAVKEIVCNKEGYKSNEVEVIYNGLDTTALVELKSYDIAGDLDFSQTDPVIGIVASLYPIKRIQDLIAAMAEVTRQVPNARMVSLGGGDQTQYLDQIESLSLSKNVFFVGPKPNPIEWIKSFSVAVLCSESEGFSNAIVEYLLCGIPVVCSDTGGNPEIIESGKNGELFPVGDQKQLATHLLKLLQNNHYRKQLAKQASLTIDHRFTIDHFTDSHIALYRSVQ